MVTTHAQHAATAASTNMCVVVVEVNCSLDVDMYECPGSWVDAGDHWVDYVGG